MELRGRVDRDRVGGEGRVGWDGVGRWGGVGWRVVWWVEGPTVCNITGGHRPISAQLIKMTAQSITT